ncbi:unnamed protein product [Paramecium pentaurelia]|uniref:Dynein light chain n=2 Tax=Paramecium TaxID=5884 RepID=A0A8S1SQV3_PAROT|nr:unnamed protein product [Paramecium octaurelia]CAD8148409.1 unnamed protein product [Paramecium pentaurelia]
MDKSVKINEKGTGITDQIQNEIVTIVKNAIQVHKQFLGEVCNQIANVLCQKYGGWWCCFVTDKDANYGSRLFHFDHMYLDATIEQKRFTIFKSAK